MNALVARAARVLPARLPLSTDALLALLCAYWALGANRAFLSGAMAAGLPLPPLLALLALLHYLLLAPLLHWRWARPVLAGVAAVVAVCSPFAQQFGTTFDPGMLRNALHTEWSESRELLGAGALMAMALQALPAWLLIAQVRLQAPASRRRALLGGLLRWSLALLAAIGLLASQYQGLASLMREHKALRYQILPAAPLWSAARLLLQRPATAATTAREPIGEDARPGPSWASAARPRLLVLVIGETVRAADWGRFVGPDGLARNTTPALDAEPGLLHWPQVQACGSDTETSLPCMFAPVGRRDYDEARIRRQQSLLHVLARAGVKLQWLDNQSGCKGVCDGLPSRALQCDGGRCLDDALFAALPEALQRARSEGGTQLLVLHMLGNHGPAYHRRVPEGYAPYAPACAQDALTRCSPAEIRNAYDNALRHTDHLLAAAWQQLRAASGEVDSALLFLPDHGESLGERGLYLHGLPYALAPREQTEVPMLLGIAPAWAQARGWSSACLAAQARRTDVQHEHLFHTLLGLLDVRTTLHEPAWDLLAPCSS